MLLTKTTGKEHAKEEGPEQFFARYILTRAFENEEKLVGPSVLRVGLVSPNTAYELSHLRGADMDTDLFMVRVASYPTKGIEDWIRTGIFSALHEANTYIYYLKSGGVVAHQV